MIERIIQRDLVEALAARLGACNPDYGDLELSSMMLTRLLARVAEVEAELASAERQDFFDLQGKLAAADAREAKLREALAVVRNQVAMQSQGWADDIDAVLKETKP
jgi:hypothetical protein